MTEVELKSWLEKWSLSASDGAKVLKIQKSKMSEYLSKSDDRTLPIYIAAHIETFEQLAESKAKKLIKKRLCK